MWSNSSATVTEMFNQPITAGKEENKPNGKNNWNTMIHFQSNLSVTFYLFKKKKIFRSLGGRPPCVHHV